MTKTQRPAASKTEYKRMMQKPIPALLLSLALPTMGSMLVTSIYNLADTFFVAQLGVEASGAVGITFSLMALIQAAGFTLGMGGGSLISLRLGKRQVREAGQIAGASFYLSLLCGLLIASIAFWREPFLRLLGASDTILPHAVSYSLYIFIAAPFLTGSLCLSHLLRAEGKTARALCGIAIGGFLNIALDPLLLRPLGIQGIALATLLCHPFIHISHREKYAFSSLFRLSFLRAYFPDRISLFTAPGTRSRFRHFAQPPCQPLWRYSRHRYVYRRQNFYDCFHPYARIRPGSAAAHRL